MRTEAEEFSGLLAQLKGWGKKERDFHEKMMDKFMVGAPSNSHQSLVVKMFFPSVKKDKSLLDVKNNTSLLKQDIFDGYRGRKYVGNNLPPKPPEEEKEAELTWLQKLVILSFGALKLLGWIFEGFKAIRKLEKVPSALGGVLKLLEIGFLLTLKPLADLLALFLMPIAVVFIKFAAWMVQQTGAVKFIIGLFELAIAIFLVMAKVLGFKNAFKLVYSLTGDLSKIIAGLFDEKAIAKTLDLLKEKIIKAWEESKLKKWADEIYEGIIKSWNESKLKIWADDIYFAIMRAWEKSYLKTVWDEIGRGIKLIFDKCGLTGIMGEIGGVLKKIVGKEGLSLVLGSLIATCMKVFNITFYAAIISALVGWIARKLDDDNPLKQFLLAIEDLCYAISLFDPLAWLWDIASDVAAAINGDFSFTNVSERIKTIVEELGKAIEHGYYFMTDMMKRLGIEVDTSKVDRLTKETNSVEAARNGGGNSGGTGSARVVPAEGSLGTGASGKAYDTMNNRAQGWIDAVDASGRSTVKPFASGGIVTSPTRALIGEAGPEAVVPLDQFSGLRNNINVSISGIVDEHKFRSIIRDEAEKIFNVHTRIRGSVW